MIARQHQLPLIRESAIRAVQKMIDEVPDFDLEIERGPDGKAKIITTLTDRTKVEQIKQARRNR